MRAKVESENTEKMEILRQDFQERIKDRREILHSKLMDKLKEEELQYE